MTNPQNPTPKPEVAVTQEDFDKALTLLSIAKAKVNVPDIHHAGMRIVGFKVDPDDFAGSLHLPIGCLVALERVARLASAPRDDGVLIPVDTLKWWLELVDLNPADLAPRIRAALDGRE